MHCLATIRIAILGAALAFSLPAHADSELDAMIEDHVMPRFDRQARAFIHRSGARFVSSSWNRETRTLIAVGELERRMGMDHFGVALETGSDTRAHGLKTDHVSTLCRHPNVKLIDRFLEKYDVTIAVVYDRKYPRSEPVVIEISHHDLHSCV